MYLLLGLIILGKNKGTLNQGNIGEHLKASILKLPDDYQEMLGSFNDDANIAGVMDLENENFASSDANLYKDSMTNVPSISISQAPQISISQSRTYDRFRSGGTLASKNTYASSSKFSSYFCLKLTAIFTNESEVFPAFNRRIESITIKRT